MIFIRVLAFLQKKITPVIFFGILMKMYFSLKLFGFIFDLNYSLDDKTFFFLPVVLRPDNVFRPK